MSCILTAKYKRCDRKIAMRVRHSTNPFCPKFQNPRNPYQIVLGGGISVVVSARLINLVGICFRVSYYDKFFSTVLITLIAALLLGNTMPAMRTRPHLLIMRFIASDTGYCVEIGSLRQVGMFKFFSGRVITITDSTMITFYSYFRAVPFQPELHLYNRTI